MSGCKVLASYLSVLNTVLYGTVQQGAGGNGRRSLPVPVHRVADSGVECFSLDFHEFSVAGYRGLTKGHGLRDGNGPLAGAPLAPHPGQQSAIPLADRGSIVCRPCGVRSFGGAVVVACARSGDAPEPAGGVAAGQLQSRCSGWAELADPGYGERPGASTLC